jgi:hypothetical protein
MRLSDKEKDTIVGVERLNRNQVLVAFSDNTVAVYSVDDLAALPNERIKDDLLNLDESA